MEIPTEISIPWVTEAIIAACGLAISFFSTIFLVYRSIIKKIDEGLAKLDTKIDAGNAALRKEIQTGDAALRRDIGTLTTHVVGLAEKVGEARGRPEEVPAPAERIAEAG